MKLDRQLLPQVDITDLIRILCGFRRERFKFEKDIAFRTFNAWMLWPDQPDVVYQAQIISAGLIIKAIKGGFLSLKTTSRSKWISALMEHVMPLEGVAELILDLPLKKPVRCRSRSEVWTGSRRSTRRILPGLSK